MNLENISIENMSRQEIKDYLFCIQDYFQKCINKGMEIDDILDNSTIDSKVTPCPICVSRPMLSA